MGEAFQEAVEAGPVLVVLSGEAGVGKSRLLRELSSRVQPAARVVHGRCVEQLDGVVPFAPFAAIVRDLVRAQGLEAVREVIPGGLADLAALTPSVPQEDRPEREPSRGRMFESVLALVDFCAGDGPLVVAVEDVHWADPGTRDLLRYVASNLESTPVLLVVTHRPPALGQALMLPAYLAGLVRSVRSRTVGLARLDLAGTATQVTGITGRPADPGVVAAVHERSGGLPLFTETLVLADGTVREDLPGHLTELLLQTVRELPERSQQVLMAVAVAGARVAHPLLCAVTGLNDASLSRAIRPAAQTGLVAADGYGYAFGHDLIRESVHDHLMLAGERVALHRAFAVALEADPLREGSSVLHGRARAAQHWRAAYEHVRALESAWLAAAVAARESAVTVESRMLEQVLVLWTRVPDAADRLGVDRVELLRRAADAACCAAQPDQGLAMVEAALELTGAPGQAAELLMLRAAMRALQMLPGVHADLRQAADLAGAGSALRFEVRVQLARSLWRRGEPGTSRALVAELVAESPGAGRARLGVELDLTRALVQDGPPGGGSQNAARAHATAVTLGLPWLEGLAARTWCECLLAEAQYVQAARLAREGVERMAQLDLDSYLGPALSACLAQAEWCRGRYEAAGEAAHDRFTEDIPRGERARLLVWQAAAQLASGATEDVDVTIDAVEKLLDDADPEPAILLTHQLNCIEHARSEGAAAAAVSRAQTLIAAVNDTLVPGRWAYLAAAYRALADSALPGPDTTPGAEAETGPELAARAWVAAERSRAIGRDHDTAWTELAAQWLALGRPPDAVYAWCRAAAAAARTDRRLAEQHLLRAVEVMQSLTAPTLARHVEALGRQLNVRAAAPNVTGAPCGLTDREMEVLRHVAVGRTNPEIARTLFISVKTASVHVSNILRKLRVSNRAAAAATAFTLHLVDPADLRPTRRDP